MKKSVYSLVLMDDVVAQVDRLAYSMHTNRSNMINQILAEYCSMLTPEKRMQSTLAQLEELLGKVGFQPLAQPSGTMLMVRSALNYKYNPSVRYRVELFRQVEPEFGQLQVQLRTQNQELIYYVNDFMVLWAKLEQIYLDHPHVSVDNGRFLRNLRYNPIFEHQGDMVGTAICNYVNYFDRALKLYFDYLDRPAIAVRAVEEIMKEYGTSEGVIV
ncbi:MAG: hypothetical protein IJ043_02780 [Clostridia bacterium]|nr:hypothetical protein [Clostridia bacterium]